MLKKLLSIAITAFIVLSVLPTSFCAASAVVAPGGTVTSYDELYEALGGSDTSVLKKNDEGEISSVQIFENIELSAPIKIISGEYLIYGAGCTVTASYKDGAFIEISGEDTIVVIGNPSGSTTVDTTFDGKDASRNGAIISVDENSRFAVYGGTVFKNSVNTGSGGAIINKGEILIYGGTFNKCRAVVSGGAIYNEGEAVFASGVIEECSSDIGGAVYNGGKATFIGTEIKSCVADKGGAVYNVSEMKYASSTVTECKARLGGAIYNDKTCEILGGTIQYCTAENGDGGAIYNASELTMSSGTIESNTAVNGGSVFNKATLTLNSGINMSVGSAERGGHIYNDESGTLLSYGGSISLGKSTYGGAIFNLGKVTLEGGNFRSNRATVAGNGVLNHGKVTMTKNGYIDPDNDFFVVLSEDNAHALVVLDGWTYNKQLVVIGCGVANENGYEYKQSVGDTLLVIEDSGVVVDERFEFYNNKGLMISQNGKLVKVPGNYKFVFYILGAVAAFAAVVTAIVCTVRFFDKKKSSAKSADDYF